MGVKKGAEFANTHSSHREILLENLRNKIVGIDFFGILHKYCRINMQNPNHYILELINLIHKFEKYGIIPWFIIDGMPIVEKSNKLKRKRRKATNDLNILSSSKNQLDKNENDTQKERENLLLKLSFSITKEHIDNCKIIFDKLGCLYIHMEKYEADSILALLVKYKHIDYVFSDDFDMFLYKDIKYIIKGLDYENDTIKLYVKEDILTNLSITSEQLIDIAFLTGTDYNCGLYKSTLESNFILVDKYKNIENIIDNIEFINKDRKDNCKILLPPYNFNFNLVRDIFTLNNINSSIIFYISKIIDKYYLDKNSNKKSFNNFFNIKYILEYIKTICLDKYTASKYINKVISYCNLHFGMTVNIGYDSDLEYEYDSSEYECDSAYGNAYGTAYDNAYGTMYDTLYKCDTQYKTSTSTSITI